MSSVAIRYRQKSILLSKNPIKKTIYAANTSDKSEFLTITTKMHIIYIFQES